jgi:hypothetical protein
MRDRGCSPPLTQRSGLERHGFAIVCGYSRVPVFALPTSGLELYADPRLNLVLVDLKIPFYRPLLKVGFLKAL